MDKVWYQVLDDKVIQFKKHRPDYMMEDHNHARLIREVFGIFDTEKQAIDFAINKVQEKINHYEKLLREEKDYLSNLSSL